MPSVSIFANPISGRGRGKKIARIINDSLSAAGYDVTLFTERADQLRRDQLDPNAAAVIVIGGDGTLRTVASRLYLGNGEHPNPPDVPPLLIVPMGTANLMGKHLGIKWTDARIGEQILQTLRARRIVRLDTATANGELLLLVAGVGIDGKIVHELTQRRTGPISYLSYAMPAITALQTFNYPFLTVHVDDKKIFTARGLAFIGNVPEYGIGFPILPSASPHDGLLDVCVLPCSCPEELMAHALRVAAGEHLHGDGVVYTTGRRIRVTSPESVPVQVDGEAAGTTPLAIDLLPLRLPFMVP